MSEVCGLFSWVENHGEKTGIGEDFVYAGIVSVVVTDDEFGVFEAKVRQAPGGDVFSGLSVLDKDHELDLGIEGFDVATVTILLPKEANVTALAKLAKIHEKNDTSKEGE